MKARSRKPRSERLTRMCEIVERWRATRTSPKSRVPERLWKQVVEVARVDGVWATSKVLRFNYTELQRRLAEAPTARTRDASIERVATEFIEIPASSVVARGDGAKVVVEMLGARNDRMRIEADPGALDIAALVRAFWSRAP